MTMKRTIVCCWLLLILLPAMDCTHQPELADLESYIQFKLERDHIPGMAALIVKDDQVVWEKGFGWADIERQVPMTENSVFCVASISKSFTAAAVMQLVEQDRTNLEAPIDRYLPFQIRNPRYPDQEMTVTQVLSHTSGISNGPSLWRNFSSGDSPISLDEWARGYFLADGAYYHAEGNFERWAPGEGFQYANAGYGLLAYLVEQVSGVPFQQYCREHILAPLDMPHSSFCIAELDSADMAVMYGFGDFRDLELDLARSKPVAKKAIDDGKWFPLNNYASPELGAGGLYTSAADLAHFLIAIMNNGQYQGKRILSHASLLKMFGPYLEKSLLPPWFGDLGMGGYSMMLNIDVPVWGHTGADPGISTIMFFSPETRLGIIVLANRFVDTRDMIQWMFAEAFAAFNNIPLTELDVKWRPWSRQYLTRFGKSKVTINVNAAQVPENSGVFVIGNHRYLGSWISKGIPLDQLPDGSWQHTWTFYDSTELVFNITRGSWNSQAVDSTGVNLPAVVHMVRGDTVLQLSVPGWKDQLIPEE